MGDERTITFTSARFWTTSVDSLEVTFVVDGDPQWFNEKLGNHIWGPVTVTVSGRGTGREVKEVDSE